MTETRRRIAEVRAVGDDRTVTLHAIRPNVVDDYGTLWDAHTFDRSLSERLPVLAWSHDWSDPLGHGVSYETSDDGPTVKFQFDDFADVPQARRAYSQVRSGTIKDCSVGFSNVKRRDPTDQEQQTYPGVREVIFEADLDEISLVLRGAVPGAKVLAFRSAGQTVDSDELVTIAKKVAAGELTQAEGKAALALLATDEPVAPADTPPPPDEADPEHKPDEQDGSTTTDDEVLEAELDAEIAEALSMVERVRP